MRNKISKKNEKLRYSLSPYRKEYDKLNTEYVPNLMFINKRNHRSKIVNTDNLGLRFNSLPKFNKSIFNTKKKTNILIGNSTVFGIGSSRDKYTIPSLLSNESELFFNLGSRAYNLFQEIILFLSVFHKIKKIKKIIILSGVNDIFFSLRESSSKTFPFPIYNNNNFLNLMNKNRYIKKNKFNISFKDHLDRVFTFWNSIQKSLNTKIVFVLQPYFYWSKKISLEEKNISTMMKGSKNLTIFNKITKSYNLYLNLFKYAAKKNQIRFYDSNDFIRRNSSDKDFYFVDLMHLNDDGCKKLSSFLKIL